jgi:hypothetical protein
VLQNTEIRENNNQQRKENRKKKEFSEKSWHKNMLVVVFGCEDEEAKCKYI